MRCSLLQFFRSRFVIYPAVVGFILGWWWLAMSSSSTLSVSSSDAPLTFQSPLLKLEPFLGSPCERKNIQEALGGNHEVMARLIADWDVEAQIWQAQGMSTIQRLPVPAFLRSQQIARQLAVIPVGPPSRRRLLPQTFVSACFLLALTDPEEILALPKGFRSQSSHALHLQTDQIPLDIEEYQMEKLHAMNPDLALVAEYSHPATVQGLKNRGIPLFTLKNIETVSDISDALLAVGNRIQSPLKAELLAHFIDAALIAIDNRLAVLKEHSPGATSNILYLHCGSSYGIPTQKTLAGQLLERLRLYAGLDHPLSLNSSSHWSTPLTKEQIIQIKPECLIVAAPSEELAQKMVFEEPAFAHLPAVKDGQIFLIDEAIQDSPTQYIVLAYFDLYQAFLQHTLNSPQATLLGGSAP